MVPVHGKPSAWEVLRRSPAMGGCEHHKQETVGPIDPEIHRRFETSKEVDIADHATDVKAAGKRKVVKNLWEALFVFRGWF